MTNTQALLLARTHARTLQAITTRAAQFLNPPRNIHDTKTLQLLHTANTQARTLLIHQSEVAHRDQ